MNVHTGSEPWNHAAALAVRLNVFVQERNIAIEDEFDDHDLPDTVYAVVYADAKTPVATGRYQPLDADTIRIARIATLKDYRGQHLGAQMVAALEDKARQEGYKTSLIHSELTAQGFYERQGYVVSSEMYLEDGVPCVNVEKKL